ncbi:perlucin-like, partial [Dreissena polymorpha]|uniref:perlucin-like n=1 Tax=Dreissena polymorpha TaxID=45954 RepID=UPI002264D1DF
ISYHGHCYHFSHDAESWIGSEGICLHFGAYLAEIDNRDEYIFIQHWVDIFARYFWVGATDLGYEGDWIWANSKKHFSNAYTRWVTGEPNNSGGSENCLALSTHWGWNDGTCSKMFNFICEKNG